MAQTQLSLAGRFTRQILDQLVEMEPDASDDFRNDPDVGNLDTESFGDGSPKLGVEDPEDDLLQLLGQVGLEKVFQLTGKY